MRRSIEGLHSRLVAAVIGVRDEPPSQLLAHYPELRDLHYRRGGLIVRVSGWLIGERSAAAVTLWRTVSLAPDAGWDLDLLLHELRHVHQFHASRAFPLAYLFETLRRGYYQNRFEVEARQYAADRLRASPMPPAKDV